ncbi:vesicle coat component [Physocladia obscura]|uniref:Protein transport protein sec16 n=1 Tax=Physocladia obscura TaxID=109957 RepID=A0AAD5TAL1_9FUNG|nr:vesicle coat component [Physocladia obscura]
MADQRHLQRRYSADKQHQRTANSGSSGGGEPDFFAALLGSNANSNGGNSDSATSDLSTVTKPLTASLNSRTRRFGPNAPNPFTRPQAASAATTGASAITTTSNSIGSLRLAPHAPDSAAPTKAISSDNGSVSANGDGSGGGGGRGIVRPNPFVAARTARAAARATQAADLDAAASLFGVAWTPAPLARATITTPGTPAFFDIVDKATATSSPQSKSTLTSPARSKPDALELLGLRSAISPVLLSSKDNNKLHSHNVSVPPPIANKSRATSPSSVPPPPVSVASLKSLPFSPQNSSTNPGLPVDVQNNYLQTSAVLSNNVSPVPSPLQSTAIVASPSQKLNNFVLPLQKQHQLDDVRVSLRHQIENAIRPKSPVRLQLSPVPQQSKVAHFGPASTPAIVPATFEESNSAAVFPTQFLSEAQNSANPFSENLELCTDQNHNRDFGADFSVHQSRTTDYQTNSSVQLQTPDISNVNQNISIIQDGIFNANPTSFAEFEEVDTTGSKKNGSFDSVKVSAENSKVIQSDGFDELDDLVFGSSDVVSAPAVTQKSSDFSTWSELEDQPENIQNEQNYSDLSNASHQQLTQNEQQTVEFGYSQDNHIESVQQYQNEQQYFDQSYHDQDHQQYYRQDGEQQFYSQQEQGYKQINHLGNEQQQYQAEQAHVEQLNFSFSNNTYNEQQQTDFSSLLNQPLSGTEIPFSSEIATQEFLNQNEQPALSQQYTENQLNESFFENQFLAPSEQLPLVRNTAESPNGDVFNRQSHQAEDGYLERENNPFRGNGFDSENPFDKMTLLLPPSGVTRLPAEDVALTAEPSLRLFGAVGDENPFGSVAPIADNPFDSFGNDSHGNVGYIPVAEFGENAVLTSADIPLGSFGDNINGKSSAEAQFDAYGDNLAVMDALSTVADHRFDSFDNNSVLPLDGQAVERVNRYEQPQYHSQTNYEQYHQNITEQQSNNTQYTEQPQHQFDNRQFGVQEYNTQIVDSQQFREQQNYQQFSEQQYNNQDENLLFEHYNNQQFQSNPEYGQEFTHNYQYDQSRDEQLYQNSHQYDQNYDNVTADSGTAVDHNNTTTDVTPATQNVPFVNQNITVPFTEEQNIAQTELTTDDFYHQQNEQYLSGSVALLNEIDGAPNASYRQEYPSENNFPMINSSIDQHDEITPAPYSVENNSNFYENSFNYDSTVPYSRTIPNDFLDGNKPQIQQEWNESLETYAPLVGGDKIEDELSHDTQNNGYYENYQGAQSLIETNGADSGYAIDNNNESQHGYNQPGESTDSHVLTHISCINCFHQLAVGSLFCNKCGTKVISQQTPVATPSIPPPQYPISGLPTQLYSSSSPPTVGISSQLVSSVPPTPSASSSGFSIPPPPPPAVVASLPPLAAAAVHGTTRASTPRGIHKMTRSRSGAPDAIYQTPNVLVGQEVSKEQFRFIDPLGRHRGHAIATFGFGGKLLTTMPQRLQRATIDGQTGRSFIVEKSFAGKINIRKIPECVGSSDSEVALTLPHGPLVGSAKKLKKKDVLKIAENGILRAEEKLSRGEVDVDFVILWKLVKLFLESDGVLMNGRAETIKSIREILMASVVPPTHLTKLDEITALLHRSDKVGACKVAVESGLWTHALVVSAQIDKDTYRDVVSAFSRQEFSSSTGLTTTATSSPILVHKDDRPGLRVLYSLFGGSGKAAVTEYFGNSPDKDQINKCVADWKETLTLIISNKTPGDSAAVSALGDVLLSYGLASASQICFLLSAAHSPFSGIDAPNVKLVLIGANHKFNLARFVKDFDALLLTEIFEYAQTLHNNIGISGNLPHLQAYKLYYAQYLSEIGFVAEATQYCEAIETCIKNYPKGSPYFHKKFADSLLDLAERLATSKPSKNSASNIPGPGDEITKKNSSFSLMNLVDRGINSLMSNAVGEDVTIVGSGGGDSGNKSNGNNVATPTKPSFFLPPDMIAQLSNNVNGSLLGNNFIGSSYGNGYSNQPGYGNSNDAKYQQNYSYDNEFHGESNTITNEFEYESTPNDDVKQYESYPEVLNHPTNGYYPDVAENVGYYDQNGQYVATNQNGEIFGGIQPNNQYTYLTDEQYAGTPDPYEYEANGENTNQAELAQETEYPYGNENIFQIGNENTQDYGNYHQHTDGDYGGENGEYESQYPVSQENSNFNNIGYKNGGAYDEHITFATDSSLPPRPVAQNTFSPPLLTQTTLPPPLVAQSTLPPPPVAQSALPLLPVTQSAFAPPPPPVTNSASPLPIPTGKKEESKLSPPPPSGLFTRPFSVQTSVFERSQSEQPLPQSSIPLVGNDNELSNKSLSTPVTAKNDEDKIPEESVNEEKRKSAPSSWFNLPSLFGGGKAQEKDKGEKTVHVAKMGDAMSLVYDPVQKKWVHGKTGEAVSNATSVPPPPMATTQSAPASRLSTPIPSDQSPRPASGMGAVMSSTGSSSSSGSIGASALGGARRRGAKKYVDVINERGPKSSASVPSFKPSFIPPAGAQIVPEGSLGTVLTDDTATKSPVSSPLEAYNSSISNQSPTASPGHYPPPQLSSVQNLQNLQKPPLQAGQPLQPQQQQQPSKMFQLTQQQQQYQQQQQHPTASPQQLSNGMTSPRTSLGQKPITGNGVNNLNGRASSVISNRSTARPAGKATAPPSDI